MSNKQEEKDIAAKDDLVKPVHGPKEIPIHIENKMYKVSKTSMTGTEIRGLAEPPIGAELDLFLVEQGPGDDALIADSMLVQIQPGMHFYTAPKTINPGECNATS